MSEQQNMPQCPNCGSANVHTSADVGRWAGWRCWDCDCRFDWSELAANYDAEIEHLRKYEAELRAATRAMEHWTPAMGRNGLLNVAGHVEMLIGGDARLGEQEAEIERLRSKLRIRDEVVCGLQDEIDALKIKAAPRLSYDRVQSILEGAKPDTEGGDK